MISQATFTLEPQNEHGIMGLSRKFWEQHVPVIVSVCIFVLIMIAAGIYVASRSALRKRLAAPRAPRSLEDKAQQQQAVSLPASSSLRARTASAPGAGGGSKKPTASGYSIFDDDMESDPVADMQRKRM